MQLWEAIYKKANRKISAVAVALPHTSFSLLHIFIGLAYSQLRLIKMKLKKVDYKFLLFLGGYKFNVCYGPLSKIVHPRRNRSL